ncbi:MAG: RNA polymerase factor sigma-54, partial [Ignavibacteriaceae bacterium]
MLSLSQKLSQQQKLSPQQIQYQKLLQLNTMALEQRIKTELELNPILEEVMDEEMEITIDSEEKDKNDETSEVDEDYENNSDEEFELEDFMNDNEFEGDRSNRSKDDEIYQPLAPAKESISEHLQEQLRMISLDANMLMLGEEIIGNLDADGYLKTSLPEILKELEMFEHVSIEPEVAEALLKRIQTFDPVGIASRNLQECLLVQLRNSSHDPYYSYLAEEMLEKHFRDFTQRRFDSIKLKMNLTDEGLKATIDLIQSLNPKPGEGNIESVEMNQITPDFII